MKTRLVVSLVGLAISFAAPTFAQQKDAPAPQLREKLIAAIKKHTDALDKNDASAVAANFTEDAVSVEQDGPTFGREAIEKLWADRFEKVQLSNNIATPDEHSPHISTDGKQMWATGSWSATIKGKDWGPKDIKGYWSVIREGDDWKIRMLTSNQTPAPAATTASTQQTNKPDPQLREALLDLAKKFDDAYNNNDPAALAGLYTEDAVLVTDQGPIYGREAIAKHHVDDFQKVHFSNWLTTYDEYSPHIIGTAGNEMWENGTWSGTIQGKDFGPIQIKGYHSSIAVREGGVWKKRILTWNVTPAPAQTATNQRKTSTEDTKQ